MHEKSGSLHSGKMVLSMQELDASRNRFCLPSEGVKEVHTIYKKAINKLCAAKNKLEQQWKRKHPKKITRQRAIKKAFSDESWSIARKETETRRTTALTFKAVGHQLNQPYHST